MKFIYESFSLSYIIASHYPILSYCIRNYLPVQHILEQVVVSHSHFHDDGDGGYSHILQPHVAESNYHTHYRIHHHICYMYICCSCICYSCICCSCIYYSCIRNLYFHSSNYYRLNNYRNILRVKESK